MEIANARINRQPAPASSLRKHSRRLSVWNTEETLDVSFQRSVVSSVADFDH